ncbi:hypothetical protein, partial [Sunxiuqinia dokdonensis]|uniref:hypothetical protein n=1 Tax=Sunxiuqinia dokdonensis TaxID=1409788 RepID=UPI0012F96556
MPETQVAPTSGNKPKSGTYPTNANSHELIALHTEINPASPNSRWEDNREPQNSTGQLSANIMASGEDLIITSGQNIPINTTTTYRSITIETGGTLTIDNGITLTVEGDWTNNGTFTANQSTVVFGGTSDATISGSSASEFYSIKIDKGTDVNSIVEANGTGLINNTGAIEIVSGVIKMTTGNFQLGGTAAYTIPATGGFWVNGATLSSGDYSITNQGLIRVSAGTANFGSSSDNNIQTQPSGTFQLSGGTVDIAGGLEVLDGAADISGGTITLAKVGHSNTTAGILQLTSDANFDMTGGTIIFHQPNSSGYLDVSIVDGTPGSKSMTGGTLQFGDGDTSPKPTSFSINSEIPISKITTYEYCDLKLTAPLTIVDQIVFGAYSFLIPNAHPVSKVASSGSVLPLQLDGGEEEPMLFQVTITGGSGTGLLTVSTTGGKPDENNNSEGANYLNRYWEIDVTGLSETFTYAVIADYGASEVNETESLITAALYSKNTAGASWQIISSSNIDTDNHVLSASGITAGSIILSGVNSAPTIEELTASSNTICRGESTTLTVTASGDPTLTYEWTSVPSGTYNATPEILVAPTETTTYKVTVTDGNGLEASDEIIITVNPDP